MNNVNSSNEEQTGFSIQTNFTNGRGYRFYADGTISVIDGIVGKYDKAKEDFSKDADLRMKRWWDLLTSEEKAIININEKRTYWANNDYEPAELVIEKGGFKTVTLVMH